MSFDPNTGSVISEARFQRRASLGFSRSMSTFSEIGNPRTMDEEPHWATIPKVINSTAPSARGYLLSRALSAPGLTVQGLLALTSSPGDVLCTLPVALCTMIRGQFRLTVATRE